MLEVSSDYLEALKALLAQHARFDRLGHYDLGCGFALDIGECEILAWQGRNVRLTLPPDVSENEEKYPLLIRLESLDAVTSISRRVQQIQDGGVVLLQGNYGRSFTLTPDFYRR